MWWDFTLKRGWLVVRLLLRSSRGGAALFGIADALRAFVLKFSDKKKAQQTSERIRKAKRTAYAVLFAATTWVAAHTIE